MLVSQIVNTLVDDIHDNNKKSGWYTNLNYETQKKLIITLVDGDENKADLIMSRLGVSKYPKANVGEKLCLIHSEISEAMEGHRKGLMDDKLPHRAMIEVELADAVIRIFDLAGHLNLDLGGAMVEKLEYNKKREDHKIENRLKDGGKTY